MGLLKKLFAKPQKAESAENPKKPRYARVQVTPLHDIVFVFDQGTLELHNISFGGMALIAPRGEWAVGTVISGLLRLNDEEFPVRATIRHNARNLVGLEFQGSSLDLKRAIESYLRVEILALNLRPVNQGFLKPDPRGEVQWFTDSRDNELYCVVNAGSVVAFNMMFLGHYLEYSGERGLRVGSVRPDLDEAPNHKRSDLLDMAEENDREKLKFARIFIHNISHVSNDLRDKLDDILNQGK